MANAYLAPMPKWITIGNNGFVSGGALMYTYSNTNKTVEKPVYIDPGATQPYPNPVQFDLNGTKGPIYWLSDTDGYFIVVTDSDGNQLYNLDNFFPPTATGGSGSSTTYLPLKNYIANNVFKNNIGNISSPLSTNIVLAPSNHDGFTPADINTVIGTYGALGPDIRFVKNNTNAIDTISFVTLSQGDNVLSPVDVTPIQYVNYSCGNNPSGEIYKSFQFPITQKVNNLNNYQITFTCWAESIGSDQTINLFFRQYFGSGTGASNEVRGPIPFGQMNLVGGGGWQQFVITATVPSTATKTLGACGDDALYLQMDMPLGVSCEIHFAKPCLFLGNIGQNATFDTYDEIDSLIQTPRTGDLKISYSPQVPFGYVAMNDGSIGSTSSNATNRANQDTFCLYKTVWDGINNNWAPIQDSSGTPTTRGASAIDDFDANNRLVLPRNLGRVLAGLNAFSETIAFTADAATDILTFSTAKQLITGTPIQVSGGSLPGGLSANTVYYVIYLTNTTIKLAITIDNAYSGTPIDISSNGSGNLNNALGSYFGESQHILTINEMPSHNHTGSNISYVNSGPPFDPPNAILTRDLITGTTGTPLHIAPQGGDLPHNNLQPTTMTNVFIKL